jgi:hypothetical protein
MPLQLVVGLGVEALAAVQVVLLGVGLLQLLLAS